MSGSDNLISLFLCGDVMTGRGIDQLFPIPCDPKLHEGYVKDARYYIELGEAENGKIDKPVSHDYIFGDGLKVLETYDPDVRIINLETSVTTSNNWQRNKGIHYRMHPENIESITSADIDCCILSNNHILDWGEEGLLDTLSTLDDKGLHYAGAGRDEHEAGSPAIIKFKEQRLLIFGFGSSTSGVGTNWSASKNSPGVNHLQNYDVDEIAELISSYKQEGDIVVVSIHWGTNWGYYIGQDQIDLAHDLIDYCGADLIHGHSSHHPRAIEVFQNKLILYGCGDFLNDYEGISGREQYRDDLTLMYFPTLDTEGNLKKLELKPLQIKNFRLNHPDEDDVQFLFELVNRDGRQFQVDKRKAEDDTYLFEWTSTH